MLGFALQSPASEREAGIEVLPLIEQNEEWQLQLQQRLQPFMLVTMRSLLA